MTYTPAPGVHVGRPPCERCGAAFRLHLPPQRACPAPWRPETVGEAERELRSAQASGDPAREFVARGDYQRLTGQRDPDQGYAAARAELERQREEFRAEVLRRKAEIERKLAEEFLPKRPEGT